MVDRPLPPSEPGKPYPGEEHETWRLLNEEGRHLLEWQRSAAERVETKAALVFGASLTAAQFVASRPVESGWLPVAIATYVLSIGFGIACVVPRRFDNIGFQESLIGLWLYPPGRAAAELANNRNAALKKNMKRHRQRVLFFWLSLVALGLGATLSTAHLALGRPDDERSERPCAAGPHRASCTPGGSAPAGPAHDGPARP